jgi:hypothetical protein
VVATGIASCRRSGREQRFCSFIPPFSDKYSSARGQPSRPGLRRQAAGVSSPWAPAAADLGPDRDRCLATGGSELDAGAVQRGRSAGDGTP